MNSASEVRTVFEQDGQQVAVCGRFMLMYISGTLTRHFFEASLETGRRLGQQHPEGVSTITVASAELELPSAPVRRLAGEVFEQSAPWTRASTTVVVGEGFRAAAARSVLTAIMLIGSRGPSHRVFATSDEAVDWLQQEVQASEFERNALLTWCYAQ